MSDVEDQITRVLRGHAAAVVVRDDLEAVLQEAAVVHLDQGDTRQRPRRYLVAAAAVMLVAGAAVAGTLAAGGDRDAPAVASTVSPQTTAVPFEPSPSTPLSRRWDDAVRAALRAADWNLHLDDLQANEREPVVVSAWADLVDGAAPGHGRVTFDLSAFAQGEYRTDPAWQMGVAGSTHPGEQTPFGTVFVADEAATAVRSVSVVTPVGVVLVHAYEVPADALPDLATFRAMALSLAEAAASVVDIS